MARISTARASYQRINPNLHIGKKPKRISSPTVSPIVYVFSRNVARPVSSFPLTIDACKRLAQISDKSPTEIFNRLVTGHRLNSMFNGYPVVLKTAR